MNESKVCRLNSLVEQGKTMYTVTLNIHTDDDIQGIKEAIAMDLEKYGDVEVVNVAQLNLTQKYRCVAKCPELDYDYSPHCQCSDVNWMFERYEDTGCPAGNLAVWEEV